MHYLKDAVEAEVQSLLSGDTQDSPLDGISRLPVLFPRQKRLVAGTDQNVNTAVLMNLAQHAAVVQCQPVCFLSARMSIQDISLWLLAGFARVELTSLYEQRLSDEESARIKAASSCLGEANLFLDRTGSLEQAILSIQEFFESNAEGGLIVIDGLDQALAPALPDSYRNKASIRAALEQAVNKLLEAVAGSNARLLASYTIPINEVDQFENKRPRFRHFAERDVITQGFDEILFTYRDEAFNPDSIDRGIIELILAKSALHPTGTSRAAYLPIYGRAENLAVEYIDEP